MLATHAVARLLTDAEVTPVQAGAITNAASLTASVSPARSRHYSNYLFENPYRAGDSQTGQKNSEHQKEQHWIA